MATDRLPMRHIREILRLKWGLKRSHRETARSLGISAGAVASVLSRATAIGLTSEALEELNLKASTLGFYRGYLDTHLLPALGDRVLPSLRRRECRELVVACRAKGVQLATLKGILRTLSTILLAAVEDDLLPANPALRMGRHLRRGDEPVADVEPFTRDEGATLLTIARERFPRWHPLLLCALRTGMRQGDLLAFRWSDVDFASGLIRADRNLVRGKITSPKNHQRRRVDMSAQLATELLELRRRERARWRQDGRSMPEAVFGLRRRHDARRG